MSLLSLRIRGRLYGGFGALVFIGIALAAIAVWQLDIIRAQVAALTLQSTNTIRAEEIATELQAKPISARLTSRSRNLRRLICRKILRRY